MFLIVKIISLSLQQCHFWLTAWLAKQKRVQHFWSANEKVGFVLLVSHIIVLV